LEFQDEIALVPHKDVLKRQEMNKVLAGEEGVVSL
jgi:hypothetical protein